jgi:hypothetical protein
VDNDTKSTEVEVVQGEIVDLPWCAGQLRIIFAEDHEAERKSYERKFEAGRILVQARAMCPGDTEFGQWLSEERLGISTRWAHTLRMVAEHESEVRAVVDRQMLTGQPNLKEALREATKRPALPKNESAGQRTSARNPVPSGSHSREQSANAEQAPPPEPLTSHQDNRDAELSTLRAEVKRLEPFEAELAQLKPTLSLMRTDLRMANDTIARLAAEIKELKTDSRVPKKESRPASATPAQEGGCKHKGEDCTLRSWGKQCKCGARKIGQNEWRAS